MQLHQIENMEQRVKRYWYEDGIAELVTGGVFVLLGAYFALQGYLGEGSPLTAILQVSLILLFIVGAYVARRLIASLKARLTYPRTGYVEYQSDIKNRRLRGLAAALFGFIVAALLIRLYRSVQELDVVVLASGVLVAVIWVVLSAPLARIMRFYLLAGLALVLGVVLSISGLPQPYALGLFYGLLGVGLMLSGGWVLRRYLDQNPVPDETAHGR